MKPGFRQAPYPTCGGIREFRRKPITILWPFKGQNGSPTNKITTQKTGTLVTQSTVAPLTSPKKKGIRYFPPTTHGSEFLFGFFYGNFAELPTMESWDTCPSTLPKAEIQVHFQYHHPRNTSSWCLALVKNNH